MKLQRLSGVLVAALLMYQPAQAAEQSSYVTPVAGPMNMATFAGTYLNPALRAIASCHNGASAPANGPSGAPLAYQCWVDTTANPSLYKLYDGASWITLGSINTSTHAWLPYLTGGVSGGVPFFSATNVMGSSALLAQYGFMVGGGAGAAPATIAACTDDQIAFGVTSGPPLCRSVSGDITFAAGVATIGPAKVTSAMLRNSGALSVIGRSANSSGVPADISCTAAGDGVLRESGSVLGCGTVATAGLANNAVTDAKLRQSAALSIIGRSANSTGNVADISASAGSSCAFRESGNTLACGTLATAALADNAVTFAKFQQIAALSMFGNCTNATANGAAVTGIADQVLRVNGAGTSCGFGAIDLSKAAAATGVIQTASVPAFSGGDVTSAGGSLTLTIGATKVTSAMLNADVFSTAHTWSAAQALGSSTATTQSPGDNSTKLATTAYADAIAALKANTASPAFTGTADIQQALALSGDISPSQLAANTNDWAPTGFSTATAVRFSTDASHNITGLAGGADGRIIILHNVGSFNAVLTNEDAASTAGNRFLFGGDMTLATNTSVTLRYDATSSRWRAITSPGSGGGGGGTVTSAGIAAGGGIAVSGTCTITTSGTCTVTGYVAPPQGRLTLATGVPVMTTTQSAKTTLYYTAYVGNQTPIYDGTSMVPTVITGGEISVATTDTTKNPAAIGASKVNDWFIWNDGGTIRLTHSEDWTNDTTRCANCGLTAVNGIKLNTTAITNGPGASRGTWLGTTRSNASSQLDWIIGGSSSGGTAAFLYVWNAYNRRPFEAVSQNSKTFWNNTTAAWASADASTTFRINFVRGLDEDSVTAKYAALAVSTSNAVQLGLGIGLDSVSALASGSTGYSTSATTYFSSVANNQIASVAHYGGNPGLGVHYLQALEYGGTNGAFNGVNGITSGGLFASVYH